MRRRRAIPGAVFGRMLPVLSACLGCLLSGCGEADGGTAGVRIIGGPGPFKGRFATPRAATWDPEGWLYVVDKTGRIQRFDREGRVHAVWSTPATEKGRPTGLAWDATGTLLVADTHYHRILRYSPEGTLLAEFGSEGTGDGQFIYPVGVAVDGEGTIFVSEYGGNDRIQVFTREGERLRGWGRYGEGDGEFKRPQGLALSGGRLYVADAANHRVQVFTPEGRFLSSWGDLHYPYSVCGDAEGNILVAEYGSHRVSKFSADGTLLARAGGPGTAPGELDTPWSAVAAGGRIFVVDAGNHRVQDWPRSVLTR